ncbi:MAG: DUF2339 domain-containing protein [Gammaproteobacteria bacterium]|nr:DUF2339 domain-containing protein [Gammaproteobacteria bacterium]MBU1777586.1 DUF2339 domain-containing protein [Gammaproteobacteria bacterium]MBU1967680.1 DUF2339 domain-containing protein [Gammaproteobacteria bacterium]
MNTEERLASIESRLTAIERFLRSTAPQTPAPVPVQAPAAQAPAPRVEPVPPPAFSRPLADSAARRVDTSFPVTSILGWAGATALVLAAIYLVVLAVDAGWLTPVRQVLLAMLGGVALITIGLLLRSKDMHYASLLPAAGVVILFLSMYGAHNYYHLVDTTFATSGIIAVCLVSLWLNRMFLNEMYALFAVVGSYTAPLFLGDAGYSIVDLIVYFACWSAVFSVFSIRVAQRSVYILAMYLALVIFDLKWHAAMPEAWLEALVFQTVHFLIFVAAASAFSARIAPMSRDDALRHLPALVLFYFVQYHILHQHVPELAPWVAIASAAILLASYFIVARVRGTALEGGRMLLSAYVALVLLHAGYIESVPAEWAPWVGLLLVPLIAAYAVMRGDMKAPGMPLWGAIGLIFFANYLSLFTGHALMAASGNVPMHDLLGICYAAELYLAYYFLRRDTALRDAGMIALYAAHIAVMVWAIQMFDSRLLVSLLWGALALGCLFLSLQRRDKMLGQSSLLIFTASVFKVFLYDIAAATPLIRIASLLVVGGSLYLGGWLYRKVNALEE